MSVKVEAGDKVKINGVIREIENITQWDEDTQRYKFVGVGGWYEIKEEQHQSKNGKNNGCMRWWRKTMKNKEWLKEEVQQIQNDGLYFRDNYSKYDQFVNVEDLIPLIDQLDEPETLSEEWINEHSKSYTMENSVEISDLKNLLLPQPKKSVIPKFVADWIDAHNLHGNNPLREYRDLENDFNEGWTDEKDAEVYHWVNKNPYAFIDSLRYGCEVEEEQKYQVIIRDGEYIRLYLCKHGDNVIIGTNDNYIKKCIEVTYLTEQEIKDYDERYWAFAQEVTE